MVNGEELSSERYGAHAPSSETSRALLDLSNNRGETQDYHDVCLAEPGQGD